MRGHHYTSEIHARSEQVSRPNLLVIAGLICALSLFIVGLSTWGISAEADEAVPATTVPPEPEPELPPPPPEPSIFPTIVPSTDLVDGQTVVVTASDLPVGANVGLAQCDSSARGTESCDLSNTRLGSVDEAGNFQSEFVVRRQPIIDGTPIDCAVAECIIGIGVLEDDLLTPRETGGALISFDASVPLPDPPTVSLSKSKNLKDGQKIRVRGEGWPDDAYDVNVEQCARFSSDPSEGESNDMFCRFVGAGPVLIGGGIDVGISVQRAFYNNQGAIDCAADDVTCQLIVRSFNRTLIQVAVDLSFDPTIPLPPPPRLNVKPRRGLVDGQTVTVTVSNYQLGQEWNLQQCVVNDDGVYNRCTYLPLEFDGSSFSVPVSRALVSNSKVVDCAAKPNQCALVFTDYSSGLAIKRGLIFAATDEPLAEPAVTFSGNLDSLVDGTRVTADVSGPLNSVMLSQCPRDVDTPQRCTQIAHSYDGEGRDEVVEVPDDEPAADEEEAAEEFGVIASDGVVEFAFNNFSLAGEVRRVLWLNGEPIDCAAEVGSCVLVAWDYELGVVGEPGSLTFVDEGPPVLPKVKVKKKKLAANEVVTARFTGLPINSYLQVMQCATGDRNACLYLPGQHVESADFSYRLRIRQFVPSAVGPVDCAAEPKACELRFSANPGEWSATVPLRFDPDAPEAPGAQISVKPSRKLVHLQQVTLEVENLFGYFSVMQCPGKVADAIPAGCTFIGWDEWTMDEETGNSTARITVRRILTTPTGRVDCAAKRQQCRIVVLDESSFQPVANTRIRFNAKVDPPGAPALIVSPSEGLVDGQDVEIIGRTDALGLRVQQCAGAEVGQFARRCREVSYSEFNGQPQKFVASVSRMIRGNDCAEVPCSLVLTNDSTGVVEVSVPLSFDPEGALMGAPRLDVTPRTGLADRQIVEATFSNFLGSHYFSQCVVEDGKATNNCTNIGQPGEQQVRRSTTVSSLTVQRMIGDHDCASAINSCAVVVQYFDDEPFSGPDDGPRRKKRLISFDPDAAPLPSPSLQVEPASGLADGQIVRASGSNWTPSSTVFLGVCSEPFELDSPEEFAGNCASEASAMVEVDPDGTFSADIALSAEQTSSETGENFDCRNGCVLVATDGRNVTFVEITFDPSAPASQTEVRNGLAWPESFRA